MSYFHKRVFYVYVLCVCFRLSLFLLRVTVSASYLALCFLCVCCNYYCVSSAFYQINDDDDNLVRKVHFSNKLLKTAQP